MNASKIAGQFAYPVRKYNTNPVEPGRAVRPRTVSPETSRHLDITDIRRGENISAIAEGSKMESLVTYGRKGVQSQSISGFTELRGRNLDILV